MLCALIGAPLCRVSYVCIFAILAFAGASPALCAALSCWALLTAVSRALMGRHYLGDVIFGLALGFLTTGLTCKVSLIAQFEAWSEA